MHNSSSRSNSLLSIEHQSSVSKRKWSDQEDERLVECVQQKGPKGWNKISSMLPGRSAKQCRERWHHKVNPTIKKGDWTSQEDNMILTSYPILHSWTKMAKLLPGRTDNDVKNRFYALERHRDHNISNLDNDQTVNELLELRTSLHSVTNNKRTHSSNTVSDDDNDNSDSCKLHNALQSKNSDYNYPTSKTAKIFPNDHHSSENHRLPSIDSLIMDLPDPFHKISSTFDISSPPFVPSWQSPPDQSAEFKSSNMAHNLKKLFDCHSDGGHNHPNILPVDPVQNKEDGPLAPPVVMPVKSIINVPFVYHNTMRK